MINFAVLKKGKTKKKTKQKKTTTTKTNRESCVYGLQVLLQILRQRRQNVKQQLQCYLTITMHYISQSQE